MQNSFSKNKTGSRILLILALVAVLAFTAMSIGAAPEAGAGDGIDGVQTKAPFGSTSRSYVVLMDLLPAVVYDGSVDGLEATKADKGEKFDASTDAAQDHAAYSLAMQDAALAAAGISQSAVNNRYTTTLNGFSANMTPAQAEKVARQPGVAKVMKDTWRQPLTDSTPSFLGLDGAGDAWDTGYTGEGVYVGIIDTGIWPEHPSVADDGSFDLHELDLEDTAGNPACNFGNLAQNHNDEPFECNNKLVAARQMLETYRANIGADPDEYDSARDDDGHGTHTATTAAGNANVPASMYGQDRGLVSGVAPRAYVLAYKALGNLGGFGSDLAAAIDQATADGVDVINYSIGGGASLTGPDDLAFLFAQDAGVLTATSAGNSGPGPGTVGGPGSVPWITTVGANTQNRFFTGDIILGDGTTITGASITPGVDQNYLVDAENAGGDLCIPGTLNPEVVAGKIVLCRRGAIARADKSLAVFQAGGVGTILYNNSDDDNLYTDTHWTAASHIDWTEGRQIKAYIAGQPFSYNTYVPVASGGAGSAVPGTPPMGSPMASIVGLGITDWNAAPSMTIFSSRGPDSVAEDIIKPDITAPGIQILAGNSPTPDPGSYPGELFQAIAGTSMSSPQIAGVFALMDQAHPTWPASVVKSAIMTSSTQDVVDNDRISPATPFSMGAGHVNPRHAATEGSPFQPGLVYFAGFNDYLGFLCDTDTSAFADPAATCAALDGLGYPTDAYNLNIPSIGVAEVAGSETIVRTVVSVAETAAPIDYMAYVDAPEGYSVTVDPETFTIAPGDDQTFEVTITNESAPVGEWAFGGLTWMSDDGLYSVYSPIAVKGTLIGIPAEVFGAGTDGSDSFDIAFGYTGAYGAAAHGLEAANVTEDNVEQDPDQDFDPDDGFSNAYPYNMDGEAFFRVVIPPDGVDNPDIDLDMFLYDPTGALYASSTNGGTDEIIDVMLPMDGTWTLYVHGWQTVGDSADYTMYDWTISATPGGNLKIDDAPDEAVLATSAPIDFSWMGAADGWNLGAISHAGDDGLIGLTLVDVDNRP